MDIPLEQLVYGSFPFWDRGYDVLAQSPGCRPEWISDVLGACRRFGEAPAGVEPSPSLFALRLASGPRAVVGVEPQGSDDRGRPGALAFHALLIPERDYRRAGSDPFAFAGALRGDWSVGVLLEARSWAVDAPSPPSPTTDPRARRVAGALAQGRRVALESARPIEGLAREVWLALPGSARRRASVATWAFGNGNRFDLVALPRLAGVALDRSYVDPASIDAGPADGPHPFHGRIPRPGRWTLMAAVGLAVVVAVGLAWREAGGPRKLDSPGDPATAPDPAGPPVGPEERARVLAGLEDLADQFEAFEIGRWGDPAELMARISDRLHYRGPTLSAADLARLAADPDPDRDRALAWHDRIRAFADDCPLPGDFPRIPLRRQLAEFARSFHLTPPARVEVIPAAMAAALAREGPIRPTPLAARYPALSDYARFLGRLPRRGE